MSERGGKRKLRGTAAVRSRHRAAPSPVPRACRRPRAHPRACAPRQSEPALGKGACEGGPRIERAEARGGGEDVPCAPPRAPPRARSPAPPSWLATRASRRAPRPPRALPLPVARAVRAPGSEGEVMKDQSGSMGKAVGRRTKGHQEAIGRPLEGSQKVVRRRSEGRRKAIRGVGTCSESSPSSSSATSPSASSSAASPAALEDVDRTASS